MKRFLLAGAALAVLTTVAGAADLPTKAPQLTAFNPYTGGFYWGLGTESSAQSTSVSTTQAFATSVVQGNIEATGQSVRGDLGYIWGGPGSWKRVELAVSYQNVTGANNGVGGFASHWSSTAEFDIGAEIFAQVWSVIPANITNPFSTVSFTPSLPSNVTVVAGAPRQYVGGLVKCEGIEGSIGTANGATVACGPGIKTGYLWQTADATGKFNGHAIDVFVDVAWLQRGFTVNGLLASTPGSPTISAGINMGPVYSAGIAIDF